MISESCTSSMITIKPTVSSRKLLPCTFDNARPFHGGRGCESLFRTLRENTLRKLTCVKLYQYSK